MIDEDLSMALRSDAGAVLGAPRLVLGGRFGGEPESITGERLVAFASAGGRFVETAVGYLGGAAVPALGRALAARPELDVVLKLGHEDGGRDMALTPANIARDLDRALDELQRDTVGVLLLHSDDPDRSVESIIDGVLPAVDDGRARALGASNWRAPRLAELGERLLALGHRPLASYHRSLAEPVPGRFHGSTLPGDRSVFEVVRGLGLPLLSWSANAGGYFASRDAGRDGPFDGPAGRARRERCIEVAARRGLDPADLALAAALAEHDVWASIGAGSAARVAQAFRAAAIPIPADELVHLRDG